jgi:hypothetical protein
MVQIAGNAPAKLMKPNAQDARRALKVEKPALEKILRS